MTNKKKQAEKNLETIKFWLRMAVDILINLPDLIEWWNNIKGH